MLRDPETGAVVRTLAGHEGGATSLAFSPDGATLVCGEGHGGARIWESRTGRLLRTCKAPGSRAATVSTDRLITSVALTPDGATLLTCTASMGNTYDEPVRLWEIRTGELKRELSDPETIGRPIAVSPDGTIDPHKDTAFLLPASVAVELGEALLRKARQASEDCEGL